MVAFDLCRWTFVLFLPHKSDIMPSTGTPKLKFIRFYNFIINFLQMCSPSLELVWGGHMHLECVVRIVRLPPYVGLAWGRATALSYTPIHASSYYPVQILWFPGCTKCTQSSLQGSNLSSFTSSQLWFWICQILLEQSLSDFQRNAVAQFRQFGWKSVLEKHCTNA